MDNITQDFLKELYTADADAVRTVFYRLRSEQESNIALYQDKSGNPTTAGMILHEVIEMLFVHGVWKRDAKAMQERGIL